MGKYTIKIGKSAIKDLRKIYTSGNLTDIHKIKKILKELE